MPTVFVYPPEDEAMPWCAFDASQENADTEMASATTTPEVEDLQPRQDDMPQTVHAHPPAPEDASASHGSQTDAEIAAAVAMPRRGSSHSSLSARRNPLRLSVIPESPKRPKERDDDDDIVEIMKVRRGEGMPDVAYANGSVPTLRRSKTLRSRAAQALRSIKNVGKGPRRPPMAEHVFPIPAKKENDQGAKIKVPTTPAPAPPTADKRAKVQPPHTQSSMPRLKKRVSQPLSNLFGLGLEEAASPNAIGANASQSHSKGGFRTLPYSRSASASTSALQLFDEVARPTSPSFSIRSTRQKFSFVNLQSIFSGSGASPSAGEQEQVPELQGAEAEANPELDCATPRAQTPVDEGWDSEEDYDSPRRHADLDLVRRLSDEGSYPGKQEFGFETRINSLHFDDFSFDADAF
jgi:hypothetical protein